MRSDCFLILLLFFPCFVYSQSILQHVALSDDSSGGNLTSSLPGSEGITLYEPLNYALGGDSVRNDRKGYAVRGWLEDYYPSGTVIHKGYYIDGQLKAYKNFYENGRFERDFKTLDSYTSIMILYYPDGTLKSNIRYKNGLPLIWEDFHPNGKLEYMEEFDKNLEYYLVKKSFFINGQLEMIFELTDTKKMLYAQKEYFENGMLKEEGKLFFNRGIFDYQKIGKWLYYDETGKLRRDEQYEEGRIIKESDY